ncbi:hypothetical protein LTR37_019911 [Vermiconidia calcicola]|uniref:Uncharacterized protein n=1 Tax=Vermiconidia calcicola TaxID=1690605 RepID=A0ACC3MCR0_9PEZI|nr:hypothetical protein LTR37_019911 [Vermiconidia calcicola]
MFLRLYPSEKLLYVPIEARHIDCITSSFRKARTAETKPTTETTSSNIQIAELNPTIETTTQTTSGMALSRKSLAGPGYIILNIIRVMNIIGLLAVITGSIVMLVKTSVASKFFFFDAVSHVLTAITGMFLATSELGLFRRYYERNWPLLSKAHGFVFLALTMLVLGINMLGNLNKPATSQKSLGMAFWRIVIASGILIFILGWVNLIASYVFRDRSEGITARMVRGKGAQAQPTPKTSSGTPPAPELAQTYIHQQSAISPTKSGNPFHIFTSERRQSILPSYHSSSPVDPPYPSARDPPISPTSRYSRATACTKKKVYGMLGRNRESVAPPLPTNQERSMEISSPMGVNPQFAHLVQRPDSALHPSRNGDLGEAYRWRAAS